MGRRPNRNYPGQPQAPYDSTAKPLLEVLKIQTAFPGCPLEAHTYDELRNLWRQYVPPTVAYNGRSPEEWGAMIQSLASDVSFQQVILNNKSLSEKLRTSFVAHPMYGKIATTDISKLAECMIFWHRGFPATVMQLNRSNDIEEFFKDFKPTVPRYILCIKLTQRDSEVAVVILNNNKREIDVYNPFGDRYPFISRQPNQNGKDQGRLNKFLNEFRDKFPDWKPNIYATPGNGQQGELSDPVVVGRTSTCIEYIYRRVRGASHAEAAEAAFKSPDNPARSRWFGYGLPDEFVFVSRLQLAPQHQQLQPGGSWVDPAGLQLWGDDQKIPDGSGSNSSYPSSGWQSGSTDPWQSGPNTVSNGSASWQPYGYASEYGYGANGINVPRTNYGQGRPGSTPENQKKLNYSILSDMRLTAIYMTKYIKSLIDAIQAGNASANVVAYESMILTLRSAVLTYSDVRLLQSLLTDVQARLFQEATVDMKEFIPSDLWQRLLYEIQHDPLNETFRRNTQRRGERGELLIGMMVDIIESVPLDKRNDFVRQGDVIMNTYFLPLQNLPDTKHVLVPGKTDFNQFLAITSKSDQTVSFAVAFMREMETLLRQLNIHVVYKRKPGLNQLNFISTIVPPLPPNRARDEIDKCEMVLRRARELLREELGPNMVANPLQALLYQPPALMSQPVGSSLLNQFQQLNFPTTNQSLFPSMNTQWQRPSWRNDKRPFQLPHYNDNPVTNRLEDLIVLLQNDLDSRELEAHLLKNKLQYWVFPVDASKVFEVEVNDTLKQYSLTDEDMRYLWGRQEFKQALANCVFLVMLILGPNYQRRLEEPVIYRMFNSLAQFRRANDNAEDADVICQLIYCAEMACMAVGHVLRPTVKDYIRRVTNACRMTNPVTDNSFLWTPKMKENAQKVKVIDRLEKNEKYKGPLLPYYDAWLEQINAKPALSF